MIFKKKKIQRLSSNQNFNSERINKACFTRALIAHQRKIIDERAGTIMVHEDRARVVPELQHPRNVPNRWFTLPNLTNTNTITTHASRTRQEIRPIEWLSLEADWDPEDMLLIRMLLPV